MKKVLVISYPYHPRHMASSICLEAVLNELKKDCLIDVITINETPFLEECEVIDSIRVFRIKSIFRLLNNKILKRIQLRINSIIRPFFWMDDGIYWMKQAYKKSVRLINENNYEYILSSSGTFSTQSIAMKLKRKYPNIIWISYIVDPFPINNPKIKYNHFYNIKRLSNKAVKFADGIAILPNLYQEYRDNLLRKYQNKCVEVDIPLLKEIKVLNKSVSKNTIDLLFVGSLSKNIRNPEYLLSLMLNIKQNKLQRKIRLTIYGGQRDCKNIINQYRESLGENLIVNDFVPREIVLNAMKESNILVSIGNSSSYLLPSKIFEYMSTGLPIINIECIDNDSSKHYLNKYGLALSLKTDWSNLQKNAEMVYKFCLEHEYSRKSYDEIEELFLVNTSKYVSNKINELMNHFKCIGGI